MKEVYVKRDLERKLERIRVWMERREEGIKTMIGGILMQERGKKERKLGVRRRWRRRWREKRSRDKKVNTDGKLLMRRLKETG